MSNNKTVGNALTQVYNQLTTSKCLNKKHTLKFLPNTPYIRSDWDNNKTSKINKDTIRLKSGFCTIGNLTLYKGYIFNVVGEDRTNGELIYHAKCSGFYYEEFGQYKRF